MSRDMQSITIMNAACGNEAEFSLYIAKEEEKYQQMKEKAAQRAIERAKNLGV